MTFASAHALDDEGADAVRADKVAERRVALDDRVVHGDPRGNTRGEIGHVRPMEKFALDAGQRFRRGLWRNRERMGENTVE